jgi:hypothetical protein
MQTADNRGKAHYDIDGGAGTGDAGCGKQRQVGAKKKMPFPSLYRSAERAHDWSLARAATYGAALGALAAAFKTLGPSAVGGGGLADGLPAALALIAAAALGFALLCAAAAGLRNFLARRLS